MYLSEHRAEASEDFRKMIDYEVKNIRNLIRIGHSTIEQIEVASGDEFDELHYDLDNVNHDLAYHLRLLRNRARQVLCDHVHASDTPCCPVCKLSIRPIWRT